MTYRLIPAAAIALAVLAAPGFAAAHTMREPGMFSASEQSEAPTGGVMPGSCDMTGAGCSANSNSAGGVFSSSELSEPPTGGVIPANCSVMHHKVSAGCERDSYSTTGDFSSTEQSEPPTGGVIAGK